MAGLMGLDPWMAEPTLLLLSGEATFAAFVVTAWRPAKLLDYFSCVFMLLSYCQAFLVGMYSKSCPSTFSRATWAII